MRKYWLFVPWLPYEIGLDRMVGECAFLNSTEVFQAPLGAGIVLENFPLAQLELKAEDFGVDCFTWESRTLVSQGLRQVMNIEPGEIQYFEVDARRSAARPRSMDYQIMNVTVAAHVADLARSAFLALPPISPDLGPMLSPLSVVVRDGFETAHQLFHDRVFNQLYCTEELAVRVLAAGCTGVRFVDPAHPIGNAMRFRTLRGIEVEEDWDPENRRFTTRVVESLH